MQTTGKQRRLGYRVLAALIAVAVVVGGADAALALRRHADAAAVCRVRADAAATRNRVVDGHGPLRVTVLGDSYAQGHLLAHAARSWPVQLAGPLHARVTVRSLGATGFAAHPCGARDAYPDRASSVMATHPDLVVVEGGLNDAYFSESRAAITRGFTLLLRRLTGPRVVVVGPTRAPFEAGGALRVDRILSQLAARAGVPYVRTYGWRLPFAYDGIHLTQAGHDTFGALVAAAITRMGS